MKSINISKEGIVEYYGNKAGYIKNHTAVMDEMFKRAEIEQYLTAENGIAVVWENGIYDRLINGSIEDSVTLKLCRVHQLKPNVDMRMKFIGYDELKRRGFGEPDMSNYRVVFDGNPGTNDLEEIYAAFNQPDLPENYTGYSMSKSDVIELYDEEGSEFYYVDSIGFVKLAESKQELVKTQESQKAAEGNKQFAAEETHMNTKPEESEFPNKSEESFQVETFKISM